MLRSALACSSCSRLPREMCTRGPPRRAARSRRLLSSAMPPEKRRRVFEYACIRVAQAGERPPPPRRRGRAPASEWRRLRAPAGLNAALLVVTRTPRLTVRRADGATGTDGSTPPPAVLGIELSTVDATGRNPGCGMMRRLLTAVAASPLASRPPTARLARTAAFGTCTPARARNAARFRFLLPTGLAPTPPPASPPRWDAPLSLL